MSEWIKISDRLPDEIGAYLVYTENINEIAWAFCNSRACGYRVVHFFRLRIGCLFRSRPNDPRFRRMDADIKEEENGKERA